MKTLNPGDLCLLDMFFIASSSDSKNGFILSQHDTLLPYETLVGDHGDLILLLTCARASYHAEITDYRIEILILKNNLHKRIILSFLDYSLLQRMVVT
jgi:hypothetical protein